MSNIQVNQPEQQQNQMQDIVQKILTSPPKQNLTPLDKPNKMYLKFTRTILQNVYLPKFKLTSNSGLISITPIPIHQNSIHSQQIPINKFKSLNKNHNNNKQFISFIKKKGIKEFTTYIKVNADKPQLKINQPHAVCRNPFPIDKILNYFQIKLITPFNQSVKPNFSFGITNDINFPQNKKKSINISFQLTAQGILEIYRNSTKIEQIDNFEIKVGDVLGCGLIYHRNQVILTFNGKILLYKFKLNAYQQKQQLKKKSLKSINETMKQYRHLYYPFIGLTLQKISLQLIFQNSFTNFSFPFCSYIEQLQNKSLVIQNQMNKQTNLNDSNLYGLVLNYFKYYGYDQSSQMLENQMIKRKMCYSENNLPNLNKFQHQKIMEEINHLSDDRIQQQIDSNIIDQDNNQHIKDQNDQWENPCFDFGDFSMMNFANLSNLFGTKIEHKRKQQQNQQKKQYFIKKLQDNGNGKKTQKKIDNLHKCYQKKFKNVRIQIIKDIKKGKLQQAFKQIQRSYKRITNKLQYLQTFFKANMILKYYNDEGFNKALQYTKKQHKCLTQYENYLFPFFNPKSLQNYSQSSIIFRQHIRLISDHQDKYYFQYVHKVVHNLILKSNSKSFHNLLIKLSVKVLDLCPIVNYNKHQHIMILFKKKSLNFKFLLEELILMVSIYNEIIIRFFYYYFILSILFIIYHHIGYQCMFYDNDMIISSIYLKFYINLSSFKILTNVINNNIIFKTQSQLMITKLYHKMINNLIHIPSYSAYIHYQDHNQKINPQHNRTYLSYMNPKYQAKIVPIQQKYIGKLQKNGQEILEQKLFQVYRKKILQGKIDQQTEQKPVDVLWGEGQIPVHYYTQFSNTQISTLSHSIVKDIQQYQQNLVNQYLPTPTITNITQANTPSKLVQLAVNYRVNNQINRSKYYQLQNKIKPHFHLLSNQQYILLKYAFMLSPKQCLPQFNKILNDLLSDELTKLSTNDLVFLMFFNRFDRYHIKNVNLQIQILRQLQHHYIKMTLQQKINFLFLYVQSRLPTIPPQSYNRHYNQIRNKTQQIIYLLNLDQNLSNLKSQFIIKLIFVLVRAKTNQTQHITNCIATYVQQKINQLLPNDIALLFIYFTHVEAQKSISNLQLMKQLKQKILTSWSELTPINKLRSLDSMYTLKLYDETVHQLYKAIPIQADSTMLSIFCRIQMMNSSSRQWEIVYKLVQLQCLPLLYFQHYKRFFNYLKNTTKWNLRPLHDKLENTQLFYNSQRLKSLALDKHYFKQITKFQKYSNIKALPYQFKFGCAIKNLQFCQLALPQYQISLDILTDVERIKGTKQIKGTYQIKIKSLQYLGWKHLYIFKQDIQYMSPQQFFEYIYKICQQHFTQQLKVITALQKKRSQQIQFLRLQKNIQSQFDEEQLQEAYAIIDEAIQKEKINKAQNI